MSTPHVFLSYAAEDAAWKRNFVYGEWFGELLGPVEFVDYRMGENLPFGPIDEWLAERIETAAVFVAFISQDYIEKRYPILEWWSGLSEVNRKGLIFVPVMLDGTAKKWWQELKQQGGLTDLGEDYAYSDFTDGNGRPTAIVTALGLPVDTVTRRIGELARLIREHLDELTPDPDEPRHPGFGDSQQIVVLGHPSAVSSEAIAAQADALVSALADGDVPFVRWRDQWRTTTASRSGLQSLGSKPHLFIQPSGPGEAGDLAGNRKLLRRWIESSLAADGRVDDGKPGDWKPVVWLPDGFDDEVFQALLKAAADDADLTLRNDSALALAHWIRAQRQGNAPTQSVPVLTLEEVDANDAGRLREALHASFYDIVGQVVQPKPELWRFEGEMLVEQIKQMDTDRAIVAVHDLNTGTARGQREARFQLEQKLGPIAAEVDRAVRASGRKLKLFYSAMLVQKAEQLPWVKYPSPSQFENWCLLPFASSPAAAGARPVVQPKEGPLKIFRNYLRDWNDNRQAA